MAREKKRSYIARVGTEKEGQGGMMSKVYNLGGLVGRSCKRTGGEEAWTVPPLTLEVKKRLNRRI